MTLQQWLEIRVAIGENGRPVERQPLGEIQKRRALDQSILANRKFLRMSLELRRVSLQELQSAEDLLLGLAEAGRKRAEYRDAEVTKRAEDEKMHCEIFHHLKAYLGAADPLQDGENILSEV